MKIVKGLVASLLSFLLFLSLSVFGLAFTLKSTALNPQFVTAELDSLPVATLVEQSVSDASTPDWPPELEKGVIKAIRDLEPAMKEHLGMAVDDIYSYLLGKTPEIHMSQVLKKALLNQQFVAAVLSKLDTGHLAGSVIKTQLSGQVPKEMAYLLEYIDSAAVAAEPELETAITSASGPIISYILGESSTLSVRISLEPVTQNIRNSLKEAFLKSPPPELVALPPAQLGQYFDSYFAQLSTQMLPTALEINESVLGRDLPMQFASAMSDTEGSLMQARQYISNFQTGYNLLIAFMVLLVLLIVLLYRSVRPAARSLGATFTTYGAFEFGGALLAKQFGLPLLPSTGLSPLDAWLNVLLQHVANPLQVLSLGFLIGGIVLLVVSFVYPKREEST